MTDYIDELLEPLLVDLGNVRELVVLLEQRTSFQAPDIQARVSLQVMRRRLDAIIASSHALLNEPQRQDLSTRVSSVTEFRTSRSGHAANLYRAPPSISSAN